MSFEIYLCSKGHETLEPSHLRDNLMRKYGMQCAIEGEEWTATYQNETTGVYAVFYHTPPSDDDELKYKGKTGLYIAVNYLRPSFFAYEIMPIIEAICKEHHYNIVTEADFKPDTEIVPRECRSEELIEEWKEGNIFSIQAFEAMKSLPPQMDYEKSVKMWQYLRVKDDLEKRLEADDIFVPRMIVVKRHKSAPLETAVIWGDGVAMVFPPCDLIVMQKVKSKGILGIGRREEMGIVRYKTVFKVIQPYLRTYSIKEPVPLNFPVLYKDIVDKARPDIMKIQFEAKWESAEVQAMDSFVDMKLGG